MRKGRKVAKHCEISIFCGSGGSKVGSLKRRVRRHLGRWEMKSCTPLWREADFEVKRYKTPGSRSTFGSWDVEKVRAVVARSTFRSQNAQNTSVSDHFWKLRCRKSARRCGANYISKSKCTKHLSVGPLLAVEMSKKCTPLWREAHFEAKMHKTPQFRTTFGSCDVEKVHAVVARIRFRSQNVQSTSVSDHFWQLRCRKSARRCGAKHISKWKCTKHYTCSRHFWRFRCRFAWQAQRIVHLVKSEQNVRVLQHFQKWWQAWGIWRGSSKMHFAWQVQYKRHVHQRCSEVRALISWEGLHFGVSDLQVCWDDFAWQVQHLVWPGINFSWQAQYFTQVEWTNRKTHWYEAPSAALNLDFWRKSRRIALILTLLSSNIEEVSQNCCGFGRCYRLKNERSVAELRCFFKLLSSKNEKVSQKSFVFNLADRQIDRQTDRDR